jgi:hypothetical protein
MSKGIQGNGRFPKPPTVLKFQRIHSFLLTNRLLVLVLLAAGILLPGSDADAQAKPPLDTLDEVVAESEHERQRQAQLPRHIEKPDRVTVRRNSTSTAKGSIRVSMQPWVPQREIRLRASDARQRDGGAILANVVALQQFPENTRHRVEHLRDRLTTDAQSLISTVNLVFTPGVDEADGLPAVIPINATTSLFNIDYVRVAGHSTQTLVVTLSNAMDPETRRCEVALGLGGGEEDFHDRFVLLGDKFGNCDRTVKSRQGDFLFADAVPQRLRQELRDLHDPVYNQFSRYLGSEPGIVFVVWRPESPRSDFRFVRSLGRTSLLLFNGPSWEHGFTSRQRDALREEVEQDQIGRRFPGGDVFTEAAADYLLKLARAERLQTTRRWLTMELPEWVAACARAMRLQENETNAPRGIYSHDCGLVVQFVYDTVARAKSKGENSVMRTWRSLLADAYRRGQGSVASSAFLDSSAEARNIVQGLLTGNMDWTTFALELAKFGLQLRVTPGQLAPSVQVQSLTFFRD